MKKKISTIVGMTMLSAMLLLTGCGDIGRNVTVGSGDKKTEEATEKKSSKKDTEEETTKKSKKTKAAEEETDAEEETTKKKSSKKDTEEETTKKSSKKDTEEETTKKSSKKDTEEETTGKSKKTSEVKVDAPAGWTKVEKTGYSFYIDESKWAESGVSGTDVSFVYTESDMFTENINVMTQNAGMYGLDLEGYKDLSVEQYDMIGYNVDEIKPMAINGADGYYALVTTEMESVKINILQWFTLIGDDAYIFTFAADEEGYEKLSSEVMQIFSTVVFE